MAQHTHVVPISILGNAVRLRVVVNEGRVPDCEVFDAVEEGDQVGQSCSLGWEEDGGFLFFGCWRLLALIDLDGM